MLTLKKVDDVIKDTFDETRVRSIESVYEKGEGDFYKLVISLHGLTFDDTIIVHTKFIFKTNLDKTALINNSFIYLHNINCIYKLVEFEKDDSEDLSDKLVDIINSNLFGEDLRNLSEFMEQSATRLNFYLKQRGIEKFTVYSVEYDPKFKMMPCGETNYDFSINIDDKYDVSLNVEKIDDGSNSVFKLTFKLLDKIENFEIGTLNNISSAISERLIDMVEAI